MLLIIGILGGKKMDDFMVGPQCEEFEDFNNFIIGDEDNV